MIERHTHALRPTSGRNEIDQDVIDLWLSLRDIIRNEEAWYIIQKWKNRLIKP